MCHRCRNRWSNSTACRKMRISDRQSPAIRCSIRMCSCPMRWVWAAGIPSRERTPSRSWIPRSWPGKDRICWWWTICLLIHMWKKACWRTWPIIWRSTARRNLFLTMWSKRWKRTARPMWRRPRSVSRRSQRRRKAWRMWRICQIWQTWWNSCGRHIPTRTSWASAVRRRF